MDDLQRRVERLEFWKEHADQMIRELHESTQQAATEHAVTRQEVRIFSGLLTEVRQSISDTRKAIQGVMDALQRHILDEAKDRQRLYVAVLTAAGTGLVSIAVLVWGVYELLSRAGQ